jgi:DNA or RNA helicases of superfamily II
MTFIPNSIRERLRPHQSAPAEHLGQCLCSTRSGLDLSVMGSGKTYVGAAVAAATKKPFLIVCPKIATGIWERAAKHFDEEFDILSYEKLRTGNTPFGSWQGGPPPPRAERETFVCKSCQQVIDLDDITPCYCHHLGIHCVETKIKPHRYGRFVWAREVEGVLFDEVHRCGRDSLNSDMLIGAKRQAKHILGLSATVASSPLQLRAIGYAAGIHALHDFERWARHHGCGRIPGLRGLHWLASKERQLEIMTAVRAQIIPEHGVRLTEADIPNFPKCDIQAELYDLPEKDTEELNRLQLEVSEALCVLESRMRNDIAPDAPITQLLRNRQRIELLKVPLASELGEDYLEKGFSVVWFVNFRQTAEELAKRFPNARVIDGSPESVRNRQKYVDEFQTNLCRELIVNNEAGGICLSLQDLDGLHPRVGLVFPCHSAVTFRQVAGRLPRDGGKSPARYRVLFANKSVEVPMHRALSGKLNNLDALNDADCRAQNLSLTF